MDIEYKKHVEKYFFFLAILFELIGKTASAQKDFAPLFPFLISYDSPENVTNMGHLLDAPAGKHGHIRIQNGHFVNDTGAVRLHATNLTGPANFLSHEQAGRLAARLARFGINCVRLHYMDDNYGNFRNEKEHGLIANENRTQRNLDLSQLEKLDYLITAFKKEGIYVDINLHVARFWDERDGFPNQDKCPWADKGLDNFEPRMIELQKEYARKLLAHVNQYTGLAYTDDPCVAMVEINNENALFDQYLKGTIDQLPDPYSTEFRLQWNDWLMKKYRSTELLHKAWKYKNIALYNEQVTDGTFTKPVLMNGNKWKFVPGSSEAKIKSSDGVLKINVKKSTNDFFPKLFRTVSVRKGQTYTVSLRIRKTEGKEETVLGFAIADGQNGWRSLGLHKTIKVDSTWEEIVVPFVAVDYSDQAQIQITRFNQGEFEIDDLSFRSGVQYHVEKTAKIESGSVPVVRLNDFVPEQELRDFYQFLVDTEQKYWLGMYNYLKNDLKVKSVISGTQLGYDPSFVQAQLDYVDNHSYWCHPAPVDTNWEIRNESMVNSMACIQWLADQRIKGKPYTVSEYNHPFPNQYGAESQPMLRAYGRLQGWDGVFEYTYNHRADPEPNNNIYFFSMVARTDILAHFPACAAIYLRGDVQEARFSVIGGIDYPAYFNRLILTKNVCAGIDATGFNSRLSLMHKTAVDFSGEQGTDPITVEKVKADQKVFVSDTHELTWNVEQPGAGYFTVNTKNTKLFTGFPAGRVIRLGDVSMTIGKTRLGWATVSLVSKNATGFGQSEQPSRILLAATGLIENKDMVIKEMSDKQIKLTDWGKGQVYVEGIPASITLPPNTKTTKCYALDPRGERKSEVPVEKDSDGNSKINISPEYQTVWYEIEIK